MSTIKNNLKTLTEADRWSFLLFTLFKLREAPEFAALSELSYLLEKKSFLNLLEYYGGSTLYIPTIEDLEILSNALLAYQYVAECNMTEEDAFDKLNTSTLPLIAIKEAFAKIKELLQNYTFTARNLS